MVSVRQIVVLSQSISRSHIRATITHQHAHTSPEHTYVYHVVFVARAVTSRSTGTDCIDDRSRWYLVKGRKVLDLACGLLFCCVCGSPRDRFSQCFLDSAQDGPCLVEYCRTCKRKVVPVYELRPGIESSIYPHDPGRRQWCDALGRSFFNVA